MSDVGPAVVVDSTRLYDADSVTVKPLLTNRMELGRLLAKHYPPALRDTGTGGRTTVSFVVDTSGRTRNVRIETTSGYPDLDHATVRVVEQMRYRAGQLHGVVVPVRVTLPITWAVTL